MSEMDTNGPAFRAMCEAFRKMEEERTLKFAFSADAGQMDGKEDEEDGKDLLSAVDDEEDTQVLLAEYGPPYDIDDLKDKATIEGLPVDDGSVKKMIIRQGIGSDVKIGNKVSIRYRSFIDLGDEPVDDKFSKKSRTFEVGGSEVLLGLDLAVMSMKRKELSLFIIAPELAYGEAGCLPIRVPPNATLIMEVELVQVFILDAEGTSKQNELQDGEAAASASAHEKGQASSVNSYIIDESTFHGRITGAKDLARQFRRNRNRGKVMYLYRNARELLDDCKITSEEEESQWLKAFDFVCYKACLRLKKVGEPRLITKICRDALQRFPDEAKYLYRWGRAIKDLASKPEDFEAARAKLNKALSFAVRLKQRDAIHYQLESIDEMEKFTTGWASREEDNHSLSSISSFSSGDES